VYAYIFELSINLFVSSLYLLVFDDDLVICCTGVDDVAGGAGEA